MQTTKLTVKHDLQNATNHAYAAIENCEAINWANLAQVISQLIAMIELIIKLFTIPSPPPAPPPPGPTA